jgi:hypothetical protein
MNDGDSFQSNFFSSVYKVVKTTETHIHYKVLGSNACEGDQPNIVSWTKLYGLSKQFSEIESIYKRNIQ